MDDKKCLEMNRQSCERGEAVFVSGWYCAESVVVVISEELGICSDLLPGVATGFCGGISKTCGMCGAVTGGILALGMVFGRRSKDDSAQLVYEAVQELNSSFMEAFGSTNCLELTGCDLGSEEGRRVFSEKNLRAKCGEYVGVATQLTREIILRHISQFDESTADGVE